MAAMTVSELIEDLENYRDDLPVRVVVNRGEDLRVVTDLAIGGYDRSGEQGFEIEVDV